MASVRFNLLNAHKHGPNCGCGISAMSQRRLDPTRTITMQRAFEAELYRRFNKLRGDIIKALVDGTDLTAFASIYDFPTDGEKVAAFMVWLDKKVQQDVLGASGRTAPAWLQRRIAPAYDRGVRRAQVELRKAAPASLPDAMKTPLGSIAAAAHADRMGAIYTRAFSDLKGITDEMDKQIARILTDGIRAGENPRKLAVAINNRVAKVGISRARTLARTEIVRAHHVATIEEYRQAGVVSVGVQAEWKTAGFNVCPECQEMEGRIFTLDEIEGMIPLHPNCRCVALPVLEL